MPSVFVTSSNFKIEDAAKSDCFCDFCAFFKTKRCERRFVFMKGVPAPKKVGNLCCRGRLRKLGADCSAIGVYCVTITWQQIFEDSLQVTVVGVLPHMTVQPERTHLRHVMHRDIDCW